MAENKTLHKPKFIKIKEIETHHSGYNVYARVVSADHKVIETHEGLKIPMVDCVIADETASARAFFKGEHAQLIQKDNVIAIRNGLKRFIKDHISLEVDLFGRVTLEKDIHINASETLNISDVQHKLERKTYNNRTRARTQGRERRRSPRREGEERPPRREGEERPRREGRENREGREGGRQGGREGGRRQDNYENRNPRNRQNNQRPDRADRPERPRRQQHDRDFNREKRDRSGEPRRDYKPRHEYVEKREENRGERKPLNWTKLAEIMPADDGLNLNVKIVFLTKVGGHNAKYRCVIGDGSAISNAFLPGRIQLREGDSVVLFNAKAEVVQEHIEIQLDSSNGRMELSRRPVDKISEEFNLSAKAWVPIE